MPPLGIKTGSKTSNNVGAFVFGSRKISARPFKLGPRFIISVIVIIITFIIASALAALGGSLLGPLFLIFPQMGDLPLLKALTAIVLGGMGSVPGAVIGGLAIGVVESVSTLFIPTDFRDTVVFGLLILTLLIRPWGLFGVRVRGES